MAENIVLTDRELNEVSRQAGLSKLEILGVIGIVNTMRSTGRDVARRAEEHERRYGPDI
jgi:hypothetical protein